MYNILSLFSGLIIAVMVAINGRLTLIWGVFGAAVVIHVVGALFAYILCRLTKKKIAIQKNLPVWLYLGGAVGVLTTVFNNFAYGKISLTSIVALGLLGQTITSLFIDCLGLFGMKKHSLKKSSVFGLVFSLAGILVMLDHTVASARNAVLISFCTGITIVLSRTINAKLSKHTGELQSSFINHVIGLPIAFVLAVVFGKSSFSLIRQVHLPDLWIYLGGVFGVSAVYLCNVIVPKVSAFRFTLLTFVGQVFLGIAIDVFTQNEYPETTMTGGLLVASGIVLNMIYEQILFNRESKKKAYWKKINDLQRDYQNHLVEHVNKPVSFLPDVIFKTRQKDGICCPYCWTKQPSTRNFCHGYGCNAKFVFEDESDRSN